MINYKNNNTNNKIDPDDRYDAKAKKELDSLLKEYKISLKISNSSSTNSSSTNSSRNNPSRTNLSINNPSRTNPSRIKTPEPKKINKELKLLTHRFSRLKLTSPIKRNKEILIQILIQILKNKNVKN